MYLGISCRDKFEIFIYGFDKNDVLLDKISIRSIETEINVFVFKNDFQIYLLVLYPEDNNTCSVQDQLIFLY